MRDTSSSASSMFSSSTWVPTKNKKYGVAIFNYKRKDKANNKSQTQDYVDGHHLALEIGETVQILEECAGGGGGGWFRGFSTRNRTKRGIFPANYIALKPFKVDNERVALFESVSPLEDPVSREVVTCLREWQTIWRNECYLRRDEDTFASIGSAINQLIEWRRQLINSSTITSYDQMKEVKVKITSRIDWGNRLLGLDLVPRGPEGQIVDPELISPIELYQVHLDTSNCGNSGAGAASSSSKSRHSQSSQSSSISNHSSNASHNGYPLHSSPRTSHFFYLHVRDVALSLPNLDSNGFELSFSIYDSSSQSLLSEKFLTRINGAGGGGVNAGAGEGLSHHKSSSSSSSSHLSTVFTDLGTSDLTRDLYLLIQVYRLGQMLLVEGKSSKSSMSSSLLPLTLGSSSSSSTPSSSSPSSWKFKRPYGQAVISLFDVIKADGVDREYSVKLSSCSNESDFHSLPETLIRGKGGGGGSNKTSTMANSSLVLNLKFLSGSSTAQVTADNPLIFKNVTCLTGKRGFPEIIMPGDVRNDLYLTLEGGEFEKGGKSIPKNIEAIISLVGADGMSIPGSISPGAPCDRPLASFTSLVLYHTNSPRWMESFKVLIPLEVFDVGAHLRIDYRHCSTKESSSNSSAKSRLSLGFSFLPLADEQGTILGDGPHELYVYKSTQTGTASSQHSPDSLLKNPCPSQYLTLPFGSKDERRCCSTAGGQANPSPSPFTRSAKERVDIRTLLCSTKLTQNGDLLSLLKWRSCPETVEEALLKVLRLEGEEIVKFLQDILDALFALFSTHDGNPTNYTGIVFKVLIHIFTLLEEPKYIHFKPVLDTYIGGHFAAALVYKGLLYCVKQCADFIGDGDKQEAIQRCFRSLEWIFKFVVQSRVLFTRATGGGGGGGVMNEDVFRQDLFTLFASFNRMLCIHHVDEDGENGHEDEVETGTEKNGTNSTLVSQVTLVDNFSSIYGQLLRLLLPLDVARVATRTINCLFYNTNSSAAATCASASSTTTTLLRAKLRLILQTIGNEALLEDVEARRELLDVITRHLKDHINRQQELKLCWEIISTIFTFLHDEKHGRRPRGGGAAGADTIPRVSPPAPAGVSLSRDVEIMTSSLFEALVRVIIEFNGKLSDSSSAGDTSTLKNASSHLPICSTRSSSSISNLHNKYICCLLTLLRLMDETHYLALMERKTRREKKDLLLQVFYVFKQIFCPNLFVPSDWMVLRLLSSNIILCSLQELSLTLTNYFLHQTNNGVTTTSCFDEQLWSSYFNLSVSFLTQSCLQLETFSELKRETILDKYADMRVLCGFQILSMWEQLGEGTGGTGSPSPSPNNPRPPKSLWLHFIPSMVAPFLEVTLVPERELRRATLPIFYDMIDAEYTSVGSFKQVEAQLIDKLDLLVSENKGDDEFRQLFKTILMERVQVCNPVWSEKGIQLVQSITKLLELLLDYRRVMDGDENRDKRMSCTLNLLTFYKDEINRKEMYIRYIYKLCDLHLSADNYTEAAFTLKLHTDLLTWSWKVTPALPSLGAFAASGDAKRTHFVGGGQQLEWETKEILYLRLIDYFDKGKCWEEGIPLIKELASFYEQQLYDYHKLSLILMKEAKFFDNILNQLRPEPEYFRVGFYGQAFPLFLRNKVFIYRGLEYEKIGAFTARIQNEFPASQVLTKSGPPDATILKSPTGQFIQICSVKPVAEPRPKFEGKGPGGGGQEVPERVLAYYRVNDVRIFTFDRPLHKGPLDRENEFKSLWVERTTHIIGSKLPGILRWFEVIPKETTTRELSPLEHACETVDNMNRELQKVITSYTASATGGDPKGSPQASISPLSMRLQGFIEAAVNGGVAKYQDAFFNPHYIHLHPESFGSIRWLKQLILQSVRILEGGLSLHSRLAPPNVHPLHRRLVDRFTIMRANVFEASSLVALDYQPGGSNYSEASNTFMRQRHPPSIINTPLPPIPVDIPPFTPPSSCSSYNGSYDGAAINGNNHPLGDESTNGQSTYFHSNGDLDEIYSVPHEVSSLGPSALSAGVNGNNGYPSEAPPIPGNRNSPSMAPPPIPPSRPRSAGHVLYPSSNMTTRDEHNTSMTPNATPPPIPPPSASLSRTLSNNNQQLDRGTNSMTPPAEAGGGGVRSASLLQRSRSIPRNHHLTAEQSKEGGLPSIQSTYNSSTIMITLGPTGHPGPPPSPPAPPLPPRNANSNTLERHNSQNHQKHAQLVSSNSNNSGFSFDSVGEKREAAPPPPPFLGPPSLPKRSLIACRKQSTSSSSSSSLLVDINFEGEDDKEKASSSSPSEAPPPLPSKRPTSSQGNLFQNPQTPSFSSPSCQPPPSTPPPPLPPSSSPPPSLTSLQSLSASLTTTQQKIVREGNDEAANDQKKEGWSVGGQRDAEKEESGNKGEREGEAKEVSRATKVQEEIAKETESSKIASPSSSSLLD